MNDKKVKKIRQLYKRDLRKKFGLEADYFKQAIKTRPWWLLPFFWRLGAKLYFTKQVRDRFE